jgi:RecJ-like exonuclease
MAKTIRTKCSKCNGTGEFLDFGGCFRCGGTGAIWISQAEAARIAKSNATRDLYHSARCAVADGLVVAREWIKAHRTDEAALNLIWAALHDDGYVAEGNALFAWMAARFPVAA